MLMLSRTEGFGLTGLEGLSAGLPVIISKNLGFGESLGSVRFGSLFVIDSEDPVHGRQPSRAPGTETESQNLTRLRLSKVPVVKDTVEKCKGLTEKMVIKLVDGINMV